MTPSSTHPPTPRSLKSTGDALVIEWSDGVTHTLPWTLVRKACPCATCRTKREQPPEPQPVLPVLDPREAQPLRVLGMRPIGNYAYGIQFSDGHNSGIYSLELLRALGEQSLPAARPDQPES